MTTPAPTTPPLSTPAGLPRFREVPVPRQLAVPLLSPAPSDLAGRSVEAGRPLFPQASPAAPPVIAPATGRVSANASALPLLSLAPRVPAVIVEPADQQPATLPALGEPPQDLRAFTERLRTAAVSANRRSSPDLIAQLEQAPHRRPDTILCSLLDGDPDLRLNALLGAREPRRIADAVAALGKVTGAARRWIVVDAALPAEWTVDLRAAAREARARVISVRNDYPQSDPTLLVYTLLGRRLRPDRLPIDRSVVMLDAAAAWSLGRHLQTHHPVLQTPFAVRDLLAGRSHYVYAPVGARVTDVLAHLDLSHDGLLLRASEPLRDIQVEPDAVITPDGELTVHLMRRELPVNPDPCIRCAWCVEGCPTRIQPAGLLEAAQRKSASAAHHYGLDACIECGICSYVCPSKLPLLQSIRDLKSHLRIGPGST